jgi:hypothetical protein
MKAKVGRALDKESRPLHWWGALPCIPSSKESSAYRRLRTIWGDQTRFRGTGSARFSEFVAGHVETNLMVTLWENFALFPEGLWLTEVARACGLSEAIQEVTACRWSYGWRHNKSARIVDILTHFQTKSDETGLLVVEAKRRAGKLDTKDLDPRTYLDLPELAEVAKKRWLLYLVDEKDAPKVRRKMEGATDNRWRLMTWQQLGGLQIALVDKLPLEAQFRSFISGAIQFQYCQHDIRPSTLAASYLESEPSVWDTDADNGGRGSFDFPPGAALWRLPGK